MSRRRSIRKAEPGQATFAAKVPLKRVHLRRLRQMYRSAGWPCLDAIEIDLLAAGLLERVMPPGQPEYLRLTDTAIQVLASSIEVNRAAFDPHEALVRKVAEWQCAQGRIAYLELTLLSKPGESWQHVSPDVFSIRRTTVERYLEPVIHEVKVRRADLLADLKKPEKHQAYLAAAGQCEYVLADGIGEPEEIPECCGALIEQGDRLIRVRSAPRLSGGVSFSTWMSLAMAVPFRRGTHEEVLAHLTREESGNETRGEADEIPALKPVDAEEPI